MKNTTLLKLNYFHALLAVVILAGFSSCSSSKDAANANDGIYGAASQKEEIVMVKDSRSGYYQNYFTQERQEVDDIITDIDNYQSYQETDTVYVDEGYEQGKAPWSYSDTKVTVHVGVGFGGYWGWGSPCFGWGYGYAGYGWGYPCGGWGWGYPGYGWGWGYPGYGWGWGYYPPYWGGYPPYYRPYPPYYGGYTYGKRYASNYGRFNTASLYNNSNSLSNRYYRSSDYNRRAQSRTYRSSSYPSNSQYKGNYNRSSRSNNRSYQPNNRSYNKPSNRSYTPRNSSPSPSMRSSSPGMSRGSSMGRSSGRRNLSYSNIREAQQSGRAAYAESNGTNRTFVKRSGANKETKATRVSYTRPTRSTQYVNNSQVKRPLRMTKSNSAGSSYRSSSGNRSSYSKSSSGRSTVSRSSGSSVRSSSGSSSVRSSGSSSGSSRSSRSSSSPRSKQ